MKNFFLLLFVLISFSSALSQNNSSVNNSNSNLNSAIISSQISEPYPVPSSSFVSFDYKDVVGGVVEIYSMSGYMVKRLELKAQSGKIVLSARDFTKGVYIYKISDFSSKILSDGKLVFE